jgi:hypothetical protein
MTPKPKEADVDTENMRTHAINENGSPQILIIEFGDIELEKDDLERISDIVLADEKTWEVSTLSKSDIIDVAKSMTGVDINDLDLDRVAEIYKKKITLLLSESINWEGVLGEAIDESLPKPRFSPP